MPAVMLDIGAGSTNFARLFRRFNQQLKLMYLCGEPEWKDSWNGDVRPKRIKKIRASYQDFRVPAGSLSVVTLNAPHPFSPPVGIEEQLARAFKPKAGVFLSAHPIGRHPELSDRYFYPIGFVQDESKPEHPCLTESFGYVHGFFRSRVGFFSVVNLPRIVYPASFTIRSRLRELSFPDELRDRSSSYLYSNSNVAPSIKVWIRNERSFL
jgi:hypothetical protein